MPRRVGSIRREHIEAWLTQLLARLSGRGSAFDFVDGELIPLAESSVVAQGGPDGEEASDDEGRTRCGEEDAHEQTAKTSRHHTVSSRSIVTPLDSRTRRWT